MGQYVRWQAIIALAGAILLAVYLNSIVVTRTTIIVPAEGGAFREGVTGAAQYLNPLLAEYNPVDADIAGLIFEGLTRDDGLGNLEPALAENWSVSADGRVYVFVLRRDVKWSDGSPFTADDVVFTLNLIRSPDFPGNPAWLQLWQGVTIEPVDDYTLRFVLAEPFPSFAYYTTVGVLPQHILKDVPVKNLLAHPFNLFPVGTGPFKPLDVTSQHILLGRNSRYRDRLSKIEQVEFKVYPDSATLYQAFAAGEIDGAGQIWPQLQTQTGIQTYSAPLPRYDMVYLNLRRPETLPFFQDSAIRQALLMLLDRQTIIDEILRGQAIPAGGPILPWSWAYNPTQAQPGYAPQKAIELLDAAGWTDSNGDGIIDNQGRAFKFTLLASDNPAQIKVAEQIAIQWKKAGVDATVESVGGDLPARLAGHQFEAALIEVELFGDPDPYRFWHQTQIETGQNFAGWDNTPASLALEQGRMALDRGERIRYYYDFQRIFAEETPSLILYYPVYTYALRDTVKNVQLSPIVTPADRFRNIGEWYLLTRRVIETTANQTFAP